MIPADVRIFLCTEPVDLRRSFDGLALAARERLGQDPRQGGLFAFVNRRANRVSLWPPSLESRQPQGIGVLQGGIGMRAAFNHAPDPYMDGVSDERRQRNLPGSRGEQLSRGEHPFANQAGDRALEERPGLYDGVRAFR